MILLIVLTGCTDFTRYKTGRSVKSGGYRYSVGEVALGGNEEDIAIVPIPKVSLGKDIGHKTEINGTVSLTALNVEIRKQILEEEKNFLNLSLEGGAGIGSYSGGFTLSKRTNEYLEPYFGVRYNNYYTRKYGILDGIDDVSNYQITVGTKIGYYFSIYPEINIFKYKEENRELKSNMLTVIGVSVVGEFGKGDSF